MRIWLNDFELNNPAKRVYMNEDIEGLDLPDIRTSRGQRAGQAGSYFGAQIFDARYITIQGSIFSGSVAEALQRRKEIQAALPLYPDRLTVRILDDDGYAYILYAQVMSFKMPIKRARMKSLFKLELEAADPTIYDDTAGSALSAPINKAVPGGFVFNSTSPVFGWSFYFSAGQPNSSVDNSSNVAVNPVIKITGATTNPILTNVTTGQVFQLDNYATASDSVTLIDMQQHTVKLGTAADIDPETGLFYEGRGGNVFGYAPLASEFWSLVPGINQIKFDSGSGADVSSALMVWRPGVMGI
ncbi:phage tail family protein [Paeniglutamicibacter sp. ABSL32-1]|uniref:phage distal tail protein n=1 Tax=Paeniglutamicibacter quisquiliarum TaxID=2849498 RepID=UPI001C2D3491|nr:phage tail family protein [Paeniglutamicibacter quisquiliarum]